MSRERLPDLRRIILSACVASTLLAGTQVMSALGTGAGAQSAPPPSAPQGSWVGAFGSAGYVLGAWNGSSNSVSTSDQVVLPAGTTFTLDQGARWCWTCPTTDVRGLQSADQSQRRAGTWYHATQIRARLSFASAYSGTLRLYALDWDALGRRERVTVTDGSGSPPPPIDITTAFNQGAWLSFPINVGAGGTVNITVDKTTGSNNAVLAGIFLGDAGPPLAPPPPPPPPPSAPQGSWVGAFGSAGYVLGAWNGSSNSVSTSDQVVLPAGTTFTLDQGARWCWTCPTTDVRGLQSADQSQRRAGTWYHATQIRARLSFASAYSGTLRLYALDWDALGRRERVTVTDGSGSPPPPIDITTAFNQGAWLSFPINVGAGGTVNITVDKTTGSNNAVLAGIFLGDAGPPLAPPPPPPPPPSAPQGSWVGAFGSAGYVLGAWNGSSNSVSTSDQVVLPAGTTFTLDQGARWCWTCPTTDVRGLQSADQSQRRAGTWYHATQIRARLSFASAYSGTLRLYALDWDALGRRERVTVTDGSGSPPPPIDITTAFNQGAWLSFPINVGAGGTVNITVDKTTGSNNAVLAGIFLGDAGPPPLPPPSPPSTSIGQYCAPALPSSPGSYKTAVDNLRKANTGWASADGSVPIGLPDGRTLWLYGDTFVGTVNSSGVMSSSKYLVENSAVLQTGNCFNPLLRGSPSARTAWIAQPAVGQAYWPSSAVVDGAGNLRVFLMHVQYNPFTVLGFKIATFSLPGLSSPPQITAKLPFTSSTRTYGTTALADNGYVYAYSTNDQNQRLARVPLGSVTNASAYQFWTGSTWSSSSGAAAPLQFNNVPTPVVGIDLHAPISGLWVVRHGNGFLGTAKLVNQFSDDVSLFTAPAPEGPWTYVGRAATTPSGRFSYGAQTVFGLQGMPASPATIYSTNVNGTPNTIDEYGPRFVTPSNMPAPLP